MPPVHVNATSFVRAENRDTQHIPIMDGWTYVGRLSQPAPRILDGFMVVPDDRASSLMIVN